MGKIYSSLGVTSPGMLHMGEFRPIDPRFVVDAVSALTATNTFKTKDNGSTQGVGNYVYPGLQVYCVKEHETWMFAPSGLTTITENTDIPTILTFDIKNWRKISDANSSVDKVQDNLNKLAAAAGVSGTASADTFGYSAHTTPTFISDQNPTSIQTEVIAIENAITPTTGTCDKVTGTTAGEKSHNNIISITKDGIEAFADLHYDSNTNKLTFVNTNGKKDIELTGVNFISGATYNKEKEEIEIYYKKYGETSASTLTIPVKDIIEEYDFKYASSGGTEYNKAFTVTDHNVSIKWTRDVSGTTAVYGDIDIFDCGTY